MYQEYREDFPGVNEITPQGVLDLEGAEETVLVDVRTAEEQAVSMLPGAITREAFEAARTVLADLYAKEGSTPVAEYARLGVEADHGAYAETVSY